MMLCVLAFCALCLYAEYDGLHGSFPRRSIGGGLAFSGLLSWTLAWIVGASAWKRYRVTRSTQRRAEQAREIDVGTKPGEIVRAGGRVVGGGSGAAQRPSEDGKVLYADHLLIEDDQRRVIGLGDPGSGEVSRTYEIGTVVFAVGELAHPAKVAPYRDSPTVAVLTHAREHALWIGLGDREAALRALWAPVRFTFKLVLALATVSMVLESLAALLLLHPTVREAAPLRLAAVLGAVQAPIWVLLAAVLPVDWAPAKPRATS
jgi:hypothetical protein